MKNISKGTIIRTLLLILTIVNQILVYFGKSPLPIENEQVEELVSLIFLIAAAVAAWWKNNSYTKEAIIADKYMKELKEQDL